MAAIVNMRFKNKNMIEKMGVKKVFVLVDES
jgi:hypothetical protein